MADGVKINVSGVWKDTTPHINVGGTWKTPDKVHINVGGVWKECWVSLTIPTVSLSSANVSHTTAFTTYAQVQYNNNGIEYSNSGGLNNYNTSRGNWKDTGDVEGAWIQYVKNSGVTIWSTNIPLSGASRLNMATTAYIRQRDINQAAGGNTTNVTVSMYDAETGGNLLGSATYSLTATSFNPCPTCCFTPDTLVTLASGLQARIVDIRKGDMIHTANGPEAVEDIITVQAQDMFRLHLDDGRHIDTSSDHPFHVKGKGPASIAHRDGVYKDLPPRHELSVGDAISDVNGAVATITGIQPISYPGTVYTFSNSLFYANGLLVY
jgi:hypothetical protein